MCRECICMSLCVCVYVSLCVFRPKKKRRPPYGKNFWELFPLQLCNEIAKITQARAIRFLIILSSVLPSSAENFKVDHKPILKVHGKIIIKEQKQIGLEGPLSSEEESNQDGPSVFGPVSISVISNRCPVWHVSPLWKWWQPLSPVQPLIRVNYYGKEKILASSVRWWPQDKISHQGLYLRKKTSSDMKAFKVGEEWWSSCLG